MGRMVNHPVEEAVIGIVSTSHFIRVSILCQLQLIDLLEQMEYCNYLLIFEGVLFRRKLDWLLAPFFLVFGGASPNNFIDMVSFPFAWEDCAISLRSLLFTPPFPFRYGWFKLFSQLLSYFSLLNQFFLGVGFNSSHTNLYSVQEVVPTCLQ